MVRRGCACGSPHSEADAALGDWIRHLERTRAAVGLRIDDKRRVDHARSHWGDGQVAPLELH
eukprot:1411931-Rhodomonas_salina.2